LQILRFLPCFIIILLSFFVRLQKLLRTALDRIYVGENSIEIEVNIRERSCFISQSVEMLVVLFKLFNNFLYLCRILFDKLVFFLKLLDFFCGPLYLGLFRIEAITHVDW
ncbi:hypothetical protein F5B20DRAFT_594315, partial [Whalleya microplaca]